MFDLHVKWNKARSCHLARTAYSLGFSGIAFDVEFNLDANVGAAKTFTGPISDEDVAEVRRAVQRSSPSDAPPTAPSSSSSSTTAFPVPYRGPHGNKTKRRLVVKRQLMELNLPALRGLHTAPEDEAEFAHQFLVLRRLTICINNVNFVAHLNTLARNTASSFDFIAVKTKEENVWNVLLKEAEFDLISLDLYGDRLPFALRRPALGLAASKGMSFEVCVGDFIRDGEARRNLVANIDPILRFLPHSSIVFTSGARDCLELRGPKDLACLAKLLAVNGATGGCVESAPIAVLFKGGARRLGGYVMQVNSHRQTDANEEESSASCSDDSVAEQVASGDSHRRLGGSFVSKKRSEPSECSGRDGRGANKKRSKTDTSVV